MKDNDRLGKLLEMLEAEPEDTFCLYGIGQEYLKAGEHARALEYFDRTLQADADYLYAYYFKAVMLGELGRMDEAHAVIREGITRARAAGNEKAESELADLRTALGRP